MKINKIYNKIYLCLLASLFFPLTALAGGNFTLQGVYYNTGEPNASYAVLEMSETGEQLKVKVGDDLGESSKLVSIEPKYIVVSQSGKMLRILLNNDSEEVSESEAKEIASQYQNKVSGGANEESLAKTGKSADGFVYTQTGRPTTKEEYVIKLAALSAFMGKDRAELQLFFEAPELSPYQTEGDLNELIDRVEKSWQ